MSPSNSSGLRTTSGVISFLPGRLTGVMASGATVTVTVHDGADTTGLVLAKLVLGAEGASREAVLSECGIVVNKGLYLAISGSGDAIVHYTVG